MEEKKAILWEEIKSGKEVKEKDKLYFRMENIKGQKIEKWLVNGNIVMEYIEDSLEVSHFPYTVNKNDAKKVGDEFVIEIKLTYRLALRACFISENEIIYSSKVSHLKGRKLKTNDEIWENLNLYFSVENEELKDDLVIDKWLINGKEFIPNHDFLEHMLWNKTMLHFKLRCEHILNENNKNVVKVNKDKNNLR